MGEALRVLSLRGTLDRNTRLQRYRKERRLLQIAIAIVSLFPLGLGGAVALTGTAGAYAIFQLQGSPPLDPTLDSGIRFLAANFVGMGMIALWVVPKVERRIVPFRIFVATGVLGASMRILSHVTMGRPNAMTQALIGVELSLLVFAFWQSRVHRMWRELGEP